MAQKRMFDKSIIETDNFLNVSLTAKALYFLLGMEADDEGFISPKRIIRLYGGEMGDLKNLIDAGLVIPFQSGVVVITDWNQNNWLDNRRIRPTQYQIEKKMLILTSQKKYELSSGLATAQLVESSIEEKRVDIVAKATIPTEFSFEEECNKVMGQNNRNSKVIIHYMKEKGFAFQNKEQYLAEFERNLKPAKVLKGYTSDQIEKAIQFCKKEYPNHMWTLETVGKRIPEVVLIK